jgi:hypothetical protein
MGGQDTMLMGRRLLWPHVHELRHRLRTWTSLTNETVSKHKQRQSAGLPHFFTELKKKFAPSVHLFQAAEA